LRMVVQMSNLDIHHLKENYHLIQLNYHKMKFDSN